MRWGHDRQDRPPRVGARMLLKALAAGLVVMVCAGTAVAGAAWFQFEKVVDPPLPPGVTPAPTVDVPALPIPKPGGPRTLLVLGSDHRSRKSIDGRLGSQALSDTIVLVRLDPKRKRIAVLSLPRDLAVTIPGVGDGVKINEAYTDGGPQKTLETVKFLFKTATGKDFPINSVIDVDFNGFRRAVDHVGGVYIDVDRRYDNPEGTGFAAINIQPGYQKLDGADALAYVRYRHTDSDLFRNARQQDFLRQAANQPAVRKVRTPSEASKLVAIFKQYFHFDKRFMTRKNLLGLLKTGVYLSAGHAPVNQIRLTGITESADPENDTRLFLSNENVALAYKQFMTGEATRNPKRRKTAAHVTAKSSALTGVENVRRIGEDMAVVADRKLHFPFYFPGLRTTGSEFVNDTPRLYRIRDYDNRKREAYRIVLAGGAPGEYFGVQGMTWRNPPILSSPDRIIIRNGRRLLLFYDGKHLRMVGFRTKRAAYWVTNTLDRAITNDRLLAIAGSLRRLNQ
jgi:polyisoprenyl-teichoic acid--peptidoglycan teichoic acid transferase